MAAKSKRRITLSSLYIGTSPLEKELVNILEHTQQANPNLETTILLDYNRSTRVNHGPQPRSSTEILQPLVSKRCNVNFFLSPMFNTLFKKTFIQPRQKWNEIISLQHMKCFLFDNTIIISGANLSDQYFVNRNDRYICIYDCQPLCDYFDDLVKTVSKFSLQLSQDGTFTLNNDWKYHPLEAPKHKFCDAAQREITAFQTRHRLNTIDEVSDKSTFVFPLLQMKMFNITDDEKFTSALFANDVNVKDLRISSGYFNFTDGYTDLLSKRSNDSECHVLMASEKVSSFYGGKGLIGYIPSVYTEVGRQFLRKLINEDSNINLWSFYRSDWTFHAKGLWLRFADNYMLTTIGSPNFGYRSVNRDLEAQLVIVTKDDELQARLVDEHESLWKFATPVKADTDLPSVPKWVQFIAPLIKSYF